MERSSLRASEIRLLLQLCCTPARRPNPRPDRDPGGEVPPVLALSCGSSRRAPAPAAGHLGCGRTRARGPTPSSWGGYMYSWVPRCPPLCALKASTAPLARSRRGLERPPRNLDLKPSFCAHPRPLTPTRVRSAAPTCAGRIVQIGSCAVRPHAQSGRRQHRSQKL